MPGRTRTRFQQLLALSAGRPVFTASNVTVVAGKVVDIHDWNDATHVLTQADSARQCLAPVGHADFAGQLCLTCDGTLGAYTSTRPASEFAYVQDGSGVLGLSVFTPLGTGNRVIWGTTSGASQNGVSHYVNSTPQARAAIYKSGGTLVAEASAGTATAGVPTYVILRHGSAGSPQYDWRLKGTVISSGPYLTTPTAGAPSHTLRFGHNTGPSLVFNGRSRTLVALFPYLSDAQIDSVIEPWVQQDTGIAA